MSKGIGNLLFLDEERFLSEAIESVLAQDYRDYEFILVDDGIKRTHPQQ